MRILTTRRISQLFFFLLFIGFCVASTLGERWWQLRGWPVNWLIQLDPLVGLATVLSTGALYAGLLWGLLTLLLTLILGRFFCGWICPFGTLHQATGWLANRNKKASEKVSANRYRKGQKIKYAILAVLLAAASGETLGKLLHLSPVYTLLLFAVGLGIVIYGAFFVSVEKKGRRTWFLWGVWIGLGWLFFAVVSDGSSLLAASLQTGLLDPIPLFYRSINLTLLPLLEGKWFALHPQHRVYPGSWLIGLFFWLCIFLNLIIPRFYCRFICPLGALFGLLGKNAIWRIGHKNKGCTSCKACDQYCEGGCEPSSVIHSHECLMCMNCLDRCREDVIGYGVHPSVAGEVTAPDLSKRSWVLSVAAGVAAVPLLRLDGLTGSNWNASVIRPPGALSEKAFLQRCIKCGQCMRICPTNVIQPAGLASGIEGLWTPALNFRMGTSGCQQGCIACGNLCPTAAIRPISLNERLGKGDFSDLGPIRIGTAFVDHGRCLPWAMNRPCIVCQENCPVSPKAIYTRETFQPVQGIKPVSVQGMEGNELRIRGQDLGSNRFSSGDFFVAAAELPEIPPVRIVRTRSASITLASNPFAELDLSGILLTLTIRLQRPFVDPALCIGCGVCEHECPVKGLRAIRVTAENETRERGHRLVL